MEILPLAMGVLVVVGTCLYLFRVYIVEPRIACYLDSVQELPPVHHPEPKPKPKPEPEPEPEPDQGIKLIETYQGWLTFHPGDGCVGVFGIRGSGKSNLLQYVIIEAIKRNIRVVVIDHKGGVDYAWLEPSVEVYADDKALGGLQAICALMEGRNKKLVEHARSTRRPCRNVDEYYQQTNEEMQRVLLVIDEIADDTDDERVLSNKLSRLSRNVGIDIFVAVQRPTKDVFHGQAQANLYARVAFRTASSEEDDIALHRRGSSKKVYYPHKISKDLPGTAVVRMGDEEFMGRAFHATDEWCYKELQLVRPSVLPSVLPDENDTDQKLGVDTPSVHWTDRRTKVAEEVVQRLVNEGRTRDEIRKELKRCGLSLGNDRIAALRRESVKHYEHLSDTEGSRTLSCS